MSQINDLGHFLDACRASQGETRGNQAARCRSAAQSQEVAAAQGGPPLSLKAFVHNLRNLRRAHNHFLLN
jgi:hypothetical protein